jgi:4-amino-4-deoxy-L-arabinose transferase-like glycosyltransferase
MSTRHGFTRQGRIDSLTLAGLLLLAAAIRIWLFFGLTGSDDSIYGKRGLEIVHGLWLESDYVGDLRYGMNLPIAATVQLFGMNEAALAVWGFLCSLAEIAIVYVFAERIWGKRVAILASLILATLPIHVSSASNMWADAPFSVFLTSAVVLLYFGARSARPGLLIAAGLACGLAGWIKPEPTVVFGLAFIIMALSYVPDRRRVAWLFVGMLIAVVPNLALFSWAFGDPLYYLHAGARNLSANFIQNASPWGEHAGNFYFRLLFLDGRSFWLAPIVALAGILAASLKGKAGELHGGRFTVLWAVLLLGFFSFFIYSLSPVRLIPKQQNYALIFAAPIALLAAIAITRLGKLATLVTMLVVCSGGLALTVLDGYGRHLHGESNMAAIRFARAHESAMVFSIRQTLDLNRVLVLINREPAGSNLQPMSQLLDSLQAGALPPDKAVFLAYHPDWPEANGKFAGLFKGGPAACLHQVAEVAGQPNTTEQLVLHLLAAIRSVVPEKVDHQLRFTDNLLAPHPVSFHSVDTACLRQATTPRPAP